MCCAALAGRSVRQSSSARAGVLLSVGVNSVVRLNNSTLHAEMLAIMMAEQRIGLYTLAESPSVSYEIVSSCDPCAMCRGAMLWSGVSRLVSGADRNDATALGFEEGPVFPESYAYLEERGRDHQPRRAAPRSLRSPGALSPARWANFKRLTEMRSSRFSPPSSVPVQAQRPLARSKGHER